MTYVGEDSYLVGVMAAKETLKRFTPKQAVFCNFHPGAANILARGQGWIDTMKAKGIPAEAIDISADPAKWAKIVAAYLKEHPKTDALFISNTGVAQAIIEYLQAAGIDVGSRIKIAQMDVSPQILDYIQQGKIMFTLDQQPYLQGYLGVVLAYLNLKYRFTPPPAPLSTGPAIITKADIDPTKSY